MHTLSFIGWPLEFGHDFAYFGATLIEAVAPQVAEPARTGSRSTRCRARGCGACTPGTCAWCCDARAPASDENAPRDDILRDQRRNIRFMMPAAVAFQALSWWLVLRFPQAMLERGGHLLLIGLTWPSARTTCSTGAPAAPSPALAAAARRELMRRWPLFGPISR